MSETSNQIGIRRHIRGKELGLRSPEILLGSVQRGETAFMKHDLRASISLETLKKRLVIIDMHERSTRIYTGCYSLLPFTTGTSKKLNSDGPHSLPRPCRAALLTGGARAW